MTRLEQALENKGDNYILPFFWQHGEDEETLREYMNAIHAANIGAVCVESRPHPDFAGDKWWTDMNVILDEAKKLGMKVWILDDSHFPTGFANGAMKDAPKNLHHKYMCYRTLEMAGPVSQVEFDLKQYMQPVPPPPWEPAPPASDDDFADDKLLAVLACPVQENESLGQPIDITDKIVDGKVVFDLPQGYFKIFVVYISRNGKGRNDYINFLDKDSCRILIDAVYEPHYAHYKELFGNVIAGFFSDEPPIGNVPGYMPSGPIGTSGQILPWSDAAMDRLTQEYGSEDWVSQVPYLWAPAADKDAQAKIRDAFMQMVSKLVEECFSRQNGDWCHDHGVEYIGHMLEDCDMNMSMGISMGHYFRGLAGQHMAGIDNIGGQVTIGGQNVPRHDNPACKDEGGFYHYMLAKLGASHAAIDPRKKGRTMCENFGAYGWQSGPKEQKYMIDHFVARGVNRFVPHAFSPAPFPDFDCPPHFYAHGQNPTYRAFGQLMAYSNRVCHLIDGGLACPDVAVLYAAEGVWAGGGTSDIPVCRHLGEAQVDFHILPADVFKADDTYPMTFDGQKLNVNGVEYGALVIPGCKYLDADVADFVKKAVAEGFSVIFTDFAPVGVTGASTEENGRYANDFKACSVVPVTNIGQYIKDQELVALKAKISPANKYITTYGYKLDNHDQLFILNEMPGQAYSGKIQVKAQGIPVRYYPWENKLGQVDYEKINDDYTQLDLSINALELCVIVFVNENEMEALAKKYSLASAKQAAGKAPVAELKDFRVGKVEAKEYLKLSREKAKIEPDQWQNIAAPFKGMQIENPDFSGYYIYEANFASPECKAYTLEIDQVYETVEAFINGISLGMKVQAPYSFEIPAEYVGKDNTLRIEVATLLERKVKAMGVNISAMSADRPLSPTGIVGEVRIYER